MPELEATVFIGVQDWVRFPLLQFCDTVSQVLVFVFQGDFK